MCKRNPDRQENSHPRRIQTDEEEFAELLGRSIRRTRVKLRFFSSFFWAAIVLLIATLVVQIPNVVLSTEYTYPFQKSIATYHFTVADPANITEKFYLNIKMTSVLSSLTSHAPIDLEAELISVGAEKSSNQIKSSYFLVMSGSNCANHSSDRQLDDSTCAIMIDTSNDNRIYNIDSMRYLSSGEFPILLATKSLFNGTVTSTENQRIFILPIESYFANQHARNALVVATFALVAFIIIEAYRTGQRRTRTSL